MGKASVKENKNIYHQIREELDLTREEAADLLEVISADKLEKIENRGVVPHPDEILIMSKKYNRPDLCNFYCSKECEIGQHYVPEVKIKNLESVVLELLGSLGGIEKKKEKLIEITADGIISEDEIDDLYAIQEQLEKISVTVEALQLWVEKNIKNRT